MRLLKLIKLVPAIKVTGYLCVRRAKCIVYLISLTKNLWYEECEELGSGGGGALSQGAGHDGSFFDSIILGKFICCLARKKSAFW